MKNFPWFTAIVVVLGAIKLFSEYGLDGLFWAFSGGVAIFFYFDGYDRVRRIETEQKEILRILERLEQKDQ